MQKDKAKSPHSKAGQGNPTGGSLKSRQKSESHPLSWFRARQKYQANSLAETDADSILAASVPVSLCAPCLADSLLSFTPFDSQSFLQLFQEVPQALREKPDEDRQFRLSVCIKSDCGSVHPLPSAAGGSLSGDNCTRHQSFSRISIAVVHQELFVCQLCLGLSQVSVLSSSQFQPPRQCGAWAPSQGTGSLLRHRPEVKAKIAWPPLPQHILHDLTWNHLAD